MRLYRTSLFLCLVALLGGCQDTDVSEDWQRQVPIELRAVAPDLSAQTKAAEGFSFKTSVFCSTRKGDYAGLGEEIAGKWKEYEWSENTEVVSTKPEGMGDVTLTNKYYPRYGDNVYLVAVSPQKEDANKDGTLSYALTGKEDLMYAAEISGNRWEVSRLGSLTYVHLLTQLVFKAKKHEAGGLDVKVTKITVKNVPTTVSLPLATGEAAFSGTSEVDLTIADATVNSAETPTDLGCLYLPPLPKSDDAQITIETSIGTFSDVSITMSGTKPEGNFQAGVSHEIMLDIRDKALGISSVEVSEWKHTYVDGSLDLID